MIQIPLVVALSCALSSAPRAESMDGWRLSELGDVSGPHKTVVSKEGLSCENLKGGIVIASCAPSWNILVFNKKSKTYCIIPFSKFTGEMNAKLYGADRTELRAATWRYDGPSQNLGHELSRYQMTPSAKLRAKGEGSSFIVKGVYWTFKNIDVPPQIVVLLSKIFQLPTQIKGLPFRLMITDATNSAYESLHTIRVEHLPEATISMEPPKGFVVKKTVEEVMVDAVSKDIFDGFSQWSEPKLDSKKK